MAIDAEVHPHPVRPGGKDHLVITGAVFVERLAVLLAEGLETLDGRDAWPLSLTGDLRVQPTLDLLGPRVVIGILPPHLAHPEELATLFVEPILDRLFHRAVLRSQVYSKLLVAHFRELPGLHKGQLRRLG